MRSSRESGSIDRETVILNADTASKIEIIEAQAATVELVAPRVRDVTGASAHLLHGAGHRGEGGFAPVALTTEADVLPIP